MNSIKAASEFLYAKITGLLPGARVYNGVAPESAPLPLICFYITASDPVKYISNLTAWSEVSALVHVWGSSYQYETAAALVSALDGLQGEAAGSSGILLSCRYDGQELLADDIDKDEAFGLVLKFILRVVEND